LLPEAEVTQDALDHGWAVDQGNNPHLVGVPPIIPDKLEAFVRDVRGDRRDKLAGGEDLEVALRC
jgi:hypothetical protein